MDNTVNAMADILELATELGIPAIIRGVTITLIGEKQNIIFKIVNNSFLKSEVTQCQLIEIY